MFDGVLVETCHGVTPALARCLDEDSHLYQNG